MGDRVRIIKVKQMFEKSYLTNFTEEMFTIYKRFVCQVPVYKLKDDTGEILDGTFYEVELQKVMIFSGAPSILSSPDSSKRLTN